MRALPSVFVIPLPFALPSNDKESDLSSKGRQNAFLSSLLRIHESLLTQQPTAPFPKELELWGSEFVNKEK